MGQKNAIQDASTEEVHNEAKRNALAYLRQWKRDRENWKYKKNIQTWLLSHAFNENMVSLLTSDIRSFREAIKTKVVDLLS